MYLQFSLIPSASFLQFDFSILPVLVGLVMIDLQSALGILILRTLLKLMLNNGGVTTLIGMPMNVVALGVFLLAMAFIWNRKPSLKILFWLQLSGLVCRNVGIKLYAVLLCPICKF